MAFGFGRLYFFQKIQMRNQAAGISSPLMEAEVSDELIFCANLAIVSRL
jgi:hypothetical protein